MSFLRAVRGHRVTERPYSFANLFCNINVLRLKTFCDKSNHEAKIVTKFFNYGLIKKTLYLVLINEKNKVNRGKEGERDGVEQFIIANLYEEN